MVPPARLRWLFGLLLISSSIAAPGQDVAGRTWPAAVDRFGDPLPQHARARLGSSRFHHGAPLHQAFYTPDGKSLVAIDNAGIVRVWDAATGRMIREIGDTRAEPWMVSPPREIALSPDGKTLAMIEIEPPGQLQLWEIASGRMRRRWHPAKGEAFLHPDFSPDGRTVAVGVQRFDEATSKSETFIELWDTAAPTERRRRLTGEWARLWGLAFSPAGKLLASTGRDTDIVRGNVLIGPGKSSVRLWELATSREWTRFPLERLDAGAIAFSPDGQRLAVAVSDGTVRLYELATGHEHEPRLISEPAEPPEGDKKAGGSRSREVVCLAFSPDGTILAGGDHLQDSSLADIHLWDVAGGRELRRIPARQQSVRSLSFSGDGRTLASAGTEPVIGLWDVGGGREAFAPSGHRSAIRSLTVSPADGTVFTGGDDGTVRHWDPSSGRESGVIARLNGSVEALAVGPDGRTLLVVGPMETKPRRVDWISLWSVAERRLILRLAPIGGDHIGYVAYSPDGKTVASAGRVRNAGSGEVLVTLQHQDPRGDHFLGFSPIFYAPDGKQLITAEPDGARVWDLATGREVRQAVRWSNHHSGAVLSPDGRFLATSGPGDAGDKVDPPIIVWELASGREIAKFEAHGEDGVCRPFAFSRDGRLLASAGGHRGPTRGSMVRVWELATGRELRRLAGHRGAVNAIAFTPDGRSLVSGSEDATGLVWDVSDLRGHPQGDPHP
jgi:WD40 repeat protein